MPEKDDLPDTGVKGRVAEAIIEAMFEKMKYNIFRFGMESTVPGFMDRTHPKTGKTANLVRKMPDFIIEKEGVVPQFIEVKFRTEGENAFRYKDICLPNQEYPYPNAYIILVSPDNIQIQKASELKKGEKLMDLSECKEIPTDTETVKTYIQICKKFFANC